MNINSVHNSIYSFKSSATGNEQAKKDENPISKAGEKAKLTQATFLAGAGYGLYLLFELMEDGTVIDKLKEKTEKITSKQKGLTQNQRMLKNVGVFAGLTMMFVGGVAAVYTLFKAPEINYQGNVNAFQKKKDMDVYIKGNTVEKELYSQMNEKAKSADAHEKEKLREQYMQMQAAKNQVPDFVKLK